MPVTFVGSDSAQSVNAGILALTLPAHQTDDVGILFIYSDQDTGTHSIAVATGWTEISDNLTSSGRDMHSSMWAKRFTSGGETNPSADNSLTEEMSASVHVFRGVETSLAMEDLPLSFASATNITEPDESVVPGNLTAGESAAGVRLMALTHDDITAVGTPTGYTSGEAITGGAVDHRQQTVAYDLDLGAAGSKSAPTFSHVLNNNVGEYHTYFILLPENLPVKIFTFNSGDVFNWGDTGLILTGEGFEAVQGAGSVRIWENVDKTGNSTLQTITSWSDTSITISTVQGALATNVQVYLEVTNDSAQESATFAIQEGVAPYTSAVAILSPDHYWKLDNNFDDTGVTGPVRNMTSGVSGSSSFPATPISEDSATSLLFGNTTSRREIADSPNMNITNTLDERTVACWIQLGGIQRSFASIWKEGGQIQNLAFLTGMGNVLLAQMADTSTKDNVQAVSNFRLAANRPYHIAMRYSYNDNPQEFRLLIDGEEQTVTDGNPLAAVNFDTHSGDVVWGDSDNNLETGGTDIAYAGPENCLYSAFGTWSENSANKGALDKVTEIRDVLFRRGAIPDETLAGDTEVNMQTALDAFADTVRPDWPLAFRVNGSSDGDFELIADNITFDDRVSLHLEYRGGGTLTWVLRNGSQIDTSKIFVTAGGTVVVVEEVDVLVTVRDIVTGNPIENARVLLEADAGGDLAVGTDLISGVTNALGQISTVLRYTNDQPVVGKVRKGSSSIFYKTTAISGTVLSTGLSLQVFMVRDE